MISLAGVGIAVAAAAGVLGTILFGLCLFLLQYRRVGPDVALIISGRRHRYPDEQGRMRERGFRIVTDGATFLLPILERCDRMSLALRTVELRTSTISEQAVGVDVFSQFRVKESKASIALAAEHFLTQKSEEVQRQFLLLLEAHVRATLSGKSLETIRQERAIFADSVLEQMTPEVSKMGLTIERLIIREVYDPRGYLENPELEQSLPSEVRTESAGKPGDDRFEEFQNRLSESRADTVAALARKQREQGKPWKCACGAETPSTARRCRACGLKI